MDRRTTPANARVAASALRGYVEAPAFIDGEPRIIADPLVDLCNNPGGARDRQVLLGDLVHVFEDRNGWSFVQSAKDDYVGYVPTNSLTAPKAATHWVAVPAGHAYTEPDIKAPVAHPLYFGTRIAMATHMPKFYETTDGFYIPKPILRPIDHRFSDPATVAQMFFGAPYLWGGNSVAGIDCSGLVQAAHLACGLRCPGDSDQQAAALGEAIPLDTNALRGDLYFWSGHVAMAVDQGTLIHANAFTMSVAYEPIDQVIRRIAAQGDGPVTVRKRLTRPPE